jgi:hypothetical protein
VPELTVEFDPETGDLNIGQAEIDTFGAAGTTCYLVEQMDTTSGDDVAVSPVIGAFSFRQPLTTGQSVEVSYFEADAEGRKVGDEIIELLPVFIRDEAAVQVARSPAVYQFNPDKLTVDERFEPVVYIGPVQQNFGLTDFTTGYQDYLEGVGQITFTRDIEEFIPVRVTYAVFEMVGGERAFETSVKPVYRPPFFIKANQTQFGLRGNRVGEFQPGQMLRLGSEQFYVRSLTYFPPRIEVVGNELVAKGDVTAVGIFPQTFLEAGSRSPGNDVLSLITPDPVTTVVDPDGDSPVVTTAPAGFMQEIPLDQFPFEPVNTAQTSITFKGDLTQFAVTGHLLEVGGYPLTVASASLSDDGTRTVITLTSGFKTSFNVSQSPTVKLSYRPAYPPGVRDFVGVGPFVAEEPFELVLFGEVDADGSELPGRTLAPGFEYTIDPNTGAIRLLDPAQAALQPGQRLLLTFTRLTALGPTLQDRTLVFPRYHADYLYNVTPSEDNGLLGAQVSGTYSFRNPDTFYFRTVSLRSFLGEAVEEALETIKSKQPAGGPLTPPQGEDNWDRGRLGLLSERRHLIDLDRSARVFLRFYNAAILAFEQVLETISGGFIGDRDGKFRFFVGTGKEYAPPGYEDEITGDLNPRLVFGVVFNAGDPSRDIVFTVADNVVNPTTATLTNGVLDGAFLNVAALDKLVESQALSILNDVDDIVLTGLDKPVKVKTPGVAPYYRFQAAGQYERMADTHFFSRLFPRAAQAFFITYPGVGAEGDDPGAYTAGREVDGEVQSTARKTIGQLGNPALGNITEVVKGTLFKRRARARIWGYFPTGIPANAFDTDGDGIGDSPAYNRPVLIVTPGLLRDFPINPATGYPDQTKFLSEGGDLPDAVAGDPDLAVPGFEAGDELGWGQPDGLFYRAYDGGSLLPTPTGSLYQGFLVEDVLYGCLITLKAVAGGPINDGSRILVGVTASSGIPADVFPIVQGDTLRVVPSTSQITSFTSAPDLATLQEAAKQSDNFRLGFDLDIQQDGSVIDLSLPSFEDPYFFGVKEILAQNSPLPQSPLEGPVQFLYESQNPFQFPALQGLEQDDDGDYALPYLKTGNTELDRFAEATVEASSLITAQDASNRYVYPDEVLGDDGTITTVATPGLGVPPANPAALRTAEDFWPSTPGPTPVGTGDVSEFDLLFIEVDQGAIGAGGQGILTVGGVSDNEIEPPRFVTPTTPPAAPSNQTGSPVRYTLDDAVVWMDNTSGYPDAQTALPLPGMFIVEDISGPGVTKLRLTGIGAPPTFNNGVTPGVGGLNDILLANPGNTITIDFIGRLDTAITTGPSGPTPPAPWPEAEVILSLIITATTVQVIDYTTYPAPGGPPVPTGTPTVFEPVLGEIHIPVVGIIPWGAPALQWFIPHVVALPLTYSLYGYEFRINVDTTAGESTTAYIGTDRLTFNEVIDMQFTRERGFVHPRGPTPSLPNLETRLVVEQVTVGGGAASTVNRDVNGPGPVPFTFLPRTTANPLDPGTIGGTWQDASTPPERGSIRVMGFEGYGNTPVTASNVLFSAAPSNPDYTDNGPICGGTGESVGKGDTFLPDILADRITDVTVSSGALTDIEQGDILTITQADHATHKATHKAGTYLVHHAVEDNTGSGYREVSLSALLGRGLGWSAFEFPQAVRYDQANSELLFTGDATDFDATSPKVVYVVRSITDIASADGTTFKESVICNISFTTIGASISDPSVQAFKGVTSGLLADGLTFVSPGDLEGYVEAGMEISRRRRLPVTVGPFDAVGLPTDNIVGWPQAPATNGFRWVTLTAPVVLGTPGPGTLFLSYDGSIGDISTGLSPATDRVGVAEGPINDPAGDNASFVNNEDRILYPRVPWKWEVNPGTAAWKQLNVPAASWGTANTSAINCILPGTGADLADTAPAGTGNDGFYAQAGIFLEPSFPTSVFDLATGGPHVVDADYSLTTGEIGMRDALSYTVPPTSFAEQVEFEVRRIRRFHGSTASQNFTPLRYVYEIRRGLITGYTSETSQFGTVVADSFLMDWEGTKPPGAPRMQDIWSDGGTYTGTNLGTFDDPDVSIHPGDVFRLLDEFGDVIEEVEISAVVDDKTLRLAPPGLTTSIVGGERFEVFLRQAPVPHEQSYEQLLDLITDRVVWRTFADEGAGTGGYVPVAEVNKLYDDRAFPDDTDTFGSNGVRPGDILIVDPMGTTLLGEKGSFPLGDRSVPPRDISPTTPNPYAASDTSDLDDNRGFYRIGSVSNSNPPYLEVTGVSTFSGDSSNDVIFPEDPTAQADMGYAVYPTVHGGTLPGPHGPDEGQQDLRPTQAPVEDPPASGIFTYRTTNYSMRPFGYRIIRPSNLFSDEAIDLVLSGRERMLSLLDLLGAVVRGLGGYFEFQRDKHAHDLGDPINFSDGLGVLSNQHIENIVGEVGFSPFVNTVTALSLHDRRFWIQDRRLDSLMPDPASSLSSLVYDGVTPFPDDGGPYTAYTDEVTNGAAVRPVLPERINTMLDSGDRFRPIRYTWLAYRTHTLLGTLAAIRRFDEELPARLEEEKRVALLQTAAAGVET